MNIDANLTSADGTTWPIRTLALHMEVDRFPRLWVQIKGQEPPADGRFTFLLMRSSDDVSVLAQLHASVWYVRSRARMAGDLCWLTLLPDPTCDLQVRPFAANAKTAAGLLQPSMDESKTTWRAEEALAPARQIQTFVSQGETFEQLARRVAHLTNETFLLCPGTDDWTLDWARTLAGQRAGAEPPFTDGVHLVGEVRHAIEPHLQEVTLPSGFDEELFRTSSERCVFNVTRPVQWLEAAGDTVTSAVALSTQGADLAALTGRWYALSEIRSVRDLWDWQSLRDSSREADEEASLALSSLFLFDGNANDSAAPGTASLFSSLLGGCELPSGVGSQGWCGYVFAVPRSQAPRDNALVHDLMRRQGVARVWSRLLECMGCGWHDLSTPQSPALGILPAIVVNNPEAPDLGPVSRSVDQTTYKRRIWVRLLGVDGAVEVDWAGLFSSFDNSAGGGSSGGDLVLVPEERSLGYVAFVGNDGAPFYFAMTRYPDEAVSAHIDPGRHKHALIVDGGLYWNSTSGDISIFAERVMTLKSLKMNQLISAESHKFE